MSAALTVGEQGQPRNEQNLAGRTSGGEGEGWAWETGRVEENRSSGGKTLGIILLVMLVILAVIVGLSVWASRG